VYKRQILNFALKGVITDLLTGNFKDKQVHWINLMDDIDVWDYNTCYFLMQNEDRYSQCDIRGGAATNIFTVEDHKKFPMIYYSASNKSYDKHFTNGRNKVIRKLPGRNNDDVMYDHTDKVIAAGPKFAFNVMESKKSYYVTDEPIYGGTICYIPTNTIEEAEKLKLFTLNNKVYRRYIETMKIKFHAFGLRNVLKFDLNQIQTGFENPAEWNTNLNDFATITLENENEVEVDKAKQLGQIYTPKSCVDKSLNDLMLTVPDAFSNPIYTFCDTMCGNGRFCINVIRRKVFNGILPETAIKTVYGCDIDPASIHELQTTLIDMYPLLQSLILKQFVVEDGLTYNFEKSNKAQFNTLFS